MLEGVEEEKATEFYAFVHSLVDARVDQAIAKHEIALAQCEKRQQGCERHRVALEAQIKSFDGLLVDACGSLSEQARGVQDLESQCADITRKFGLNREACEKQMLEMQLRLDRLGGIARVSAKAADSHRVELHDVVGRLANVEFLVDDIANQIQSWMDELRCSQSSSREALRAEVASLREWCTGKEALGSVRAEWKQQLEGVGTSCITEIRNIEASLQVSLKSELTAEVTSLREWCTTEDAAMRQHLRGEIDSEFSAVRQWCAKEDSVTGLRSEMRQQLADVEDRMQRWVREVSQNQAAPIALWETLQQRVDMCCEAAVEFQGACEELEQRITDVHLSDNRNATTRNSPAHAGYGQAALAVAQEELQLRIANAAADTQSRLADLEKRLLSSIEGATAYEERLRVVDCMMKDNEEQLETSIRLRQVEKMLGEHDEGLALVAARQADLDGRSTLGDQQLGQRIEGLDTALQRCVSVVEECCLKLQERCDGLNEDNQRLRRVEHERQWAQKSLRDALASSQTRCDFLQSEYDRWRGLESVAQTSSRFET